MIVLTGYNSGKKIYIDERNIARVTDGHDLVGDRSYPWSEVMVVTDDFKSEKFRVIESARLIGKLMVEAMGLTEKKK